MHVLIADAAPHARSALRLLLEQHRSVSRVFEVASAERLLDEVKKARADVLIVDWQLHGLDLGELRRALPALKISVLSSRPEERRPALAAGADTFLFKGDAPETLLAHLGLRAD